MSIAAQISPAHMTGSQSVRFERLLPGPIERVWDYLTKPDLQRTWLAESTAEVLAITGCRPLRSLEYSMRDSSVVSLELEPRGSQVLLVLTHRVPAFVPDLLAGVGTVLAVALLVFSFCRSGDAVRPPQGLGSPMAASAAGLSSLHPRPGHFTVC
jgi:hypothetical protein